MAITIKPSELSQAIGVHRQLANQIIESERIFLSLSETGFKLSTQSQSGTIVTGQSNGNDTCIVSYKLLVNVLNALKSEPSVIVDLKNHTMELKGKKTYEIPMQWVTDEMRSEFYKQEGTDTTVTTLEGNLSNAVSQTIKAVTSIAANAPITTMIRKKDGNCTIVVGCGAAVIGLISAKTEDKSDVTVYTKDNALLKALTKLGLMGTSQTISFGKEHMILKDDNTVIHHTLTTSTKDIIPGIRQLTDGLKPTSSIIVNTAAFMANAKDAMAVAAKNDRLPLVFTAAEVETTLASGQQKYSYKGAMDGYILSGQETSIALPLSMAYAIAASLTSVTESGPMCMDIYVSGQSKVICISGVSPSGVKAEFIFKLQSISI